MWLAAFEGTGEQVDAVQHLLEKWAQMRILIITRMPPYPPISGTPIRVYNLLRRLAADHDIWLATFVGKEGKPEDVQHLRGICEGVLTSRAPQLGAMARPVDALRYLARRTPIELRLYHSADMMHRLQELTRELVFDVVEIVDSYMAVYVEALPARMLHRTVLTFIDIESRKYERIWRLEPSLPRRLRLWLYSWMMRRWEPRYAQRFERCVTVSEADRRQLLAANPRLQVDVIPNGVDTKIYRPLPEGDSTPALVFVGNMGYRPNVDAMLHFCSQVLPRVRRAVPQAEMWIVGINPHPEVRQLDGHGVHVTGRVDDLRPYYGRSSVCVVPLRAGGGTRLKILEAMALGRPVVSTSIGCEGLDVVHGKHLLVADSADDFAQQTVRLLTDETLKKSIVAEARRLVMTCYDWDVIARKQMQIYRQMAE